MLTHDWNFRKKNTKWLRDTEICPFRIIKFCFLYVFYMFYVPKKNTFYFEENTKTICF